LETSFAAPQACYFNKHKHDEHVTRLMTLLQNWPAWDCRITIYGYDCSCWIFHATVTYLWPKRPSEMGLVTHPALLVDHYYDDCRSCRKRRSGGCGAGVAL